MEREIKVPVDYIPSYAFALPAYELPGITWSLDPKTILHKEYRAHVSEPDVAKLMTLGRGVEPVGWSMAKVEFGKFDRFLAKVAHSYAIAVNGCDYFEPLLCNIIRFGDANSRYVVGGFLEECPASLHTWELQTGIFRNPAGQCLMNVAMRFLGFLGTPVYVVVVGKITPWQFENFQPNSHCGDVTVQFMDLNGVPIPSHRPSWGEGIMAFLKEKSGSLPPLRTY